MAPIPRPAGFRYVWGDALDETAAGPEARASSISRRA